jgi:cytochrome c-type biogenesis protein CcmI
MDVVAFAVILVALAAFVAAPLYRQSAADAPEPPSADSRAEADLRALGDLEVDRESGLIDDADYAQERSAIEGRAADPPPRPTTDVRS